MKKLTTTMKQRTLNKQDGRLTIGAGSGEKWSASRLRSRRSLH
jgi:hypothetical protein